MGDLAVIACQMLVMENCELAAFTMLFSAVADCERTAFTISFAQDKVWKNGMFGIKINEMP